MKVSLSFIFLISLGFSPLAGVSQNNVDSSIEASIKEYEAANKTELTDSIKYYGHLNELSHLKYKIRYSRYFMDNFEHRKNTFNWQLKSSKIIFFTVIAVVLSGLFFSGLQFYYTMKLPAVKSNSTATKNDEVPKLAVINKTELTELEISMTNGLKIKSSIIGLIILITSIAFFYLYLIHVYPINEQNIDSFNSNKVEEFATE